MAVKQIEADMFYRKKHEPADIYLLRVKKHMAYDSPAWHVHSKTVNDAFTEFLRMQPSKKHFCAVVGNLIFTASMVYDLWGY